MEQWDLIIIGAGAAGLAAGIYAARSGLKTLIIDEKMAGGTAADAPIMENYPGFLQISGAELSEKMVLHCRKTGATIRELETVIALDLKGEKKTVKTARSTYEAAAIIIASGAHYREIGVKGEKEFRGKGVSYCGVCDGPFFKNKRVLVVGGGNAALATALYLSGIAAEVTVAHRRDAFRADEALVKDAASRKNIKALLSTEIREITGEKVVNKVVLFDSKAGETKELAVDGVFVQVGEAPNSQIAREAGVEVDEHGCIKIDMFQRTNIAGVYAAGDVTNHPVKQVGTAVGQGITAALEAYSCIRRPYYRR
ncbi:MAG TPA: thioredoxin-disulfide reductase [Candidatus Bathyarchaeia archaeon]